MALNAIRSSVDNKMAGFIASKMINGGARKGKSVGAINNFMQQDQ